MKRSTLGEKLAQKCEEIGRSKADVSRAATGQKDAISRIMLGHDPGISRVESICREIGLELYIGPPHPTPQSIEKKANPPSTSPALTPVKDRDLAELLALLADEWEALNPHGREQLATRFRAAFPELRGGQRYQKLSAGSAGK